MFNVTYIFLPEYVSSLSFLSLWFDRKVFNCSSLTGSSRSFTRHALTRDLLSIFKSSLIPGNRCELTLFLLWNSKLPVSPNKSHLRRSGSASTIIAQKGSARAQRFCTTAASSRQGSLGETAIPFFLLTSGLNQSLLCHCSLPSRAHRQNNLKPSQGPTSQA